MEHVGAMGAVLEQLRTVLASAGGAGGEPVTGASDDGLVVAELGPDGRLRSLTADPRARRHPETIATSIVEAVNDAVDRLAERDADGGSSWTDGLRAVQEESTRVMAQAVGDYTAAVRRMEDLHR